MEIIQAPTTQQIASTDGTVFNATFYNLGDWNMDTTPSIALAHGLTGSKILGMMAIVRDDNDQLHIPLTHGIITAAAEVNGYFYESVPGTITFTRRTGGFFDDISFDATSYNRGYLCIFHLP